MHKSILILGLALMLASPAAAAEESSNSTDRAIGLGFGAAVGAISGKIAGFGITATLEPTPTFEILTLELRLQPSQIMSIDLQWNWIPMLFQLVKGNPLYEQRTYFHFLIPARTPLSLAIAPGFQFGFAKLSGEKYGYFGAIARLGIDVTGRKRASSMGVYLRPGITHLEMGETTMAAYEAMLEVNFTFYGMRK